jgi:hypothetical protein
VTYKLSALEHQGRYAERERVSKVVCGTTEELVRRIPRAEYNSCTEHRDLNN